MYSFWSPQVSFYPGTLLYLFLLNSAGTTNLSLYICIMHILLCVNHANVFMYFAVQSRCGTINVICNLPWTYTEAHLWGQAWASPTLGSETRGRRRAETPAQWTARLDKRPANLFILVLPCWCRYPFLYISFFLAVSSHKPFFTLFYIKHNTCTPQTRLAHA